MAGLIVVLETAWKSGGDMRTLFFLINFYAAVCFAILCIGGFVLGFYGQGSPYSFMGGFIFFWPAAIMAGLEWRAYLRGANHLDWQLGVVWALLGAVVVYGLGASLVEAIHENRLEDWAFWLTYAGISLGIGAYTAVCCWYRMRGLWAWKKQHAMNHAAGDVVHRA